MKKNELIGIGIILLIISVATFFNLRNSLLLARDVQRKNDLKHIAAALTAYTDKAGGYPGAKDGKIANCGNDMVDVCRWGIDPLNASDSAIMERMPNDPSWAKGYSYLYRSNKRDFQLYAHLEDKDEEEIDRDIEKKGFSCGVAVCNFGLSSSQLPLTKNIEEVFEELNEIKN